MNILVKRSISIVIIVALMGILIIPSSQVLAGRVNGVEYEEIYSSSEVMLEVIREQISKHYSKFVCDPIVQYKTREYRTNTGGHGYPISSSKLWISEREGKYHLTLPKDYILYCRVFKDDLDKYIGEFDFSNHDLGDISDMSCLDTFAGVKVMKFRNCGITSLKPFQDEHKIDVCSAFKYVESLDLGDNYVPIGENTYSILQEPMLKTNGIYPYFTSMGPTNEIISFTEDKNNTEERPTVITYYPTVNQRDGERIYSSSKAVLEIIFKSIEKHYWHFLSSWKLEFIDQISFSTTHGQGYPDYVNIEKHFLREYGDWYYLEVPRDYATYCKAYEKDQEKYIEKFDFSNIELGDLSDLTCLALFKGVKKLDFSNCGITDLAQLKDNMKVLSGRSIELRANVVNKKDYEEFEKLAKENNVKINSKPIIKDTTTSNKNDKTSKTSNLGVSNGVVAGITGINNINVKTSTPTVKNTTQKAKDENKGISTGVLNGIQNIKKETNTEQKAENGGSSPKTTVAQNKSTYQPNQSITVITTETITVSSELETSSEVKGNKVILHVKITGDKAPYVAYLPSDCQVYLNGGMNSIGTVGNDGTFTYEVNKTGTYDFEIRPCTYPEGNHERVTVDDIEKPKYTLKTEYYNAKQEGGLDGIRVKLALTDNKCLKSVTFNNKKHDVSAWKSFTQAFQVTKTGDYKIRVEDRAGNVIEKTEHIVVDTSKPKVSALKIYKNSEEIEGVCRAKIGDKLSVVISANKQIKGLRTNRITKDIIFIK